MGVVGLVNESSGGADSRLRRVRNAAATTDKKTTGNSQAKRGSRRRDSDNTTGGCARAAVFLVPAVFPCLFRPFFFLLNDQLLKTSYACRRLQSLLNHQLGYQCACILCPNATCSLGN